MRVRPCVIIPQKNRILLLRYRYNNTNVYGLPGGSPEAGETLKETLIRELKEELSIDIKTKNLLFMGEIILKNERQSILNCVFSGAVTGGYPAVNPSHSTALEYVWAPIKELGGMNLYPNIGERIFKAAEINFKGHTVYIGRIDQKWF